MNLPFDRRVSVFLFFYIDFVSLFVRHPGRQMNLNPGRGCPFSKLGFYLVRTNSQDIGIWLKVLGYRKRVKRHIEGPHVSNNG
jgi:hypothetical protein